MKIEKVGTSAWRAEQSVPGIILSDGTNISLPVTAVSYESASDALKKCLGRFINHLIR